jgi:hypothetical protein
MIIMMIILIILKTTHLETNFYNVDFFSQYTYVQIKARLLPFLLPLLSFPDKIMCSVILTYHLSCFFITKGKYKFNKINNRNITVLKPIHRTSKDVFTDAIWHFLQFSFVVQYATFIQIFSIATHPFIRHCNYFVNLTLTKWE